MLAKSRLRNPAGTVSNGAPESGQGEFSSPNNAALKTIFFFSQRYCVLTE
jgi:hypothetical protein